MSPELKELYDSQVKDLYAAIGKACVDFEHLCHSLRVTILHMLQAHGLSNQRVSQVMMADLTAQPLLSIYQALIAETLKLTEGEQRICDKLCSQIKSLIERRNDIVHATWFVGWAGSEDKDFSKTNGHRWKRGKAGSMLKGENLEAEDFLSFAGDCLAVANIVMSAALIHIDGCRIENNYCITPAGKVARIVRE